MCVGGGQVSRAPSPHAQRSRPCLAPPRPSLTGPRAAGAVKPLLVTAQWRSEQGNSKSSKHQFVPGPNRHESPAHKPSNHLRLIIEACAYTDGSNHHVPTLGTGPARGPDRNGTDTRGITSPRIAKSLCLCSSFSNIKKKNDTISWSYASI